MGLDLDKCIKDGAFSNEAREVLQKVNSYSERATVGKGSESFYTGSFPKKGGDAAALNVMTQAGI